MLTYQTSYARQSIVSHMFSSSCSLPYRYIFLLAFSQSFSLLLMVYDLVLKSLTMTHNEHNAGHTMTQGAQHLLREAEITNA
jgi:hypothetical protein